MKHKLNKVFVFVSGMPDMPSIAGDSIYSSEREAKSDFNRISKIELNNAYEGMTKEEIKEELDELGSDNPADIEVMSLDEFVDFLT